MRNQTNILQMPDGTKFDAWTYVARLIELWNKGNIVNSILGDTTTNVELIKDETGKVWRIKYYLPQFVDVQDRKLVVKNYFEKGFHERKPLILKPIYIDIDREVSTDIIQLDDWDQGKLEDKIDQLTTVKGLFAMEPIRRRERIFFELHRMIAQIGEKEHTPKDGIKRIREIKSDATDQEITKAYQDAKDDLLGLLTKHIDGLEEDDIAFIMPPKHITAVSNTQALNGGSNSQEQLEKGQIGWVSGVKVYRTAKAEGIGYVTLRGAAFAPIMNPLLVTHPAPSDMPAIAEKWATVKVDKDKVILTDATIALGDITKINADIRELPDKSPLVPKKPEESQEKIINENHSSQLNEIEKLKADINEVKNEILTEKEKNEYLTKMFKDMEESENLRMRADEESKRYHEQHLQEIENEQLNGGSEPEIQEPNNNQG